jgi:hypothetical protein
LRLSSATWRREGHYAATQLCLDNLDRRIERIERRLSLIEA